jgi:hypothetical protein
VARTEVYRDIPLYGELHRYIPALAHLLGYRIAERVVNHRPRTQGTSKYGFERYVRGAIDLLTVVTITKYGRRPAHLFGGVGLLSGMIGFLILLYLTGVWAFTDEAIGTRPLLNLGMLLVILGGLLSSTLVNLFVVPSLFLQSGPSPESDMVAIPVERVTDRQVIGAR